MQLKSKTERFVRYTKFHASASVDTLSFPTVKYILKDYVKLVLRWNKCRDSEDTRGAVFAGLCLSLIA